MGIDGAEIKRRRELLEQKKKSLESPPAPPPQQPFAEKVLADRQKLVKAWVAALAVAGTMLLYVAAGPALTLNAIKKAAIDEDQKALEKKIDFPLLRENLKGQMRQVMASSIEDAPTDNPFMAMTMSFASVAADGLVNMLITPQALLKMVQEDKDGTDPPSLLDIILQSSIAIDSLDQVTVTMGEKKDQGNSPQLVLTRDLFSWTLTNILIDTENSPMRERSIVP